mmetsp:Transcript_74696/g.134598  ORF Transcript_74696/g.134598 Transcript_74696/m.134598 type:complete len:112 (-) Transcript_74696:279-614(-)
MGCLSLGWDTLSTMVEAGSRQRLWLTKATDRAARKSSGGTSSGTVTKAIGRHCCVAPLRRGARSSWRIVAAKIERADWVSAKLPPASDSDLLDVDVVIDVDVDIPEMDLNT